jgi:hypothetical protein
MMLWENLYDGLPTSMDIKGHQGTSRDNNGHQGTNGFLAVVHLHRQQLLISKTLQVWH